MSRVTWLKERFDPAVEQGIGHWMEPTEDPELGTGIFAYEEGPKVRVFEKGVTYDGDTVWTLRYAELTALDLLDLRALMKAQKAPREPVELAVLTADVRRTLRVPLFLYTTLASILNALVDGKTDE